MKKTLLLIILAVYLSGCSKVNPTNEQDSSVTDTPTSDVSTSAPATNTGTSTPSTATSVPSTDTKTSNTSASAPNTDTTLYTNSEFNVSFRYPSAWQLIENDSGSEPSVNFIIPDEYKTNIYFYYQADNSEVLEKGRNLDKADKKEEIYFANNQNYPAIEYGMHHASYFVIHMKNNYVLFGAEAIIDDAQILDLEKILDSLSFNN